MLRYKVGNRIYDEAKKNTIRIIPGVISHFRSSARQLLALGLNFLSGEPDTNLTLPTLSVGHPIPYLGLLNHRDQAFSTLLDFDFHLLCPLFHRFEYFWVDYSDPMAPVILDEGGITAESNFIPMSADTFVVFEKHYFASKVWPSAGVVS